MYASPPSHRVAAGGLAALVLAALLWALVAGLAVRFGGVVPEALATFTVVPPAPAPPPPPPEHKPVKAPRARPVGEAGAPNRVSRATEVVVLRPIVPPPIPLPVVAAPRPASGSDASSGAAPIAGPGIGAGGVGDGAGGGGRGGWGDGEDETPPRWRRGRLKDSDIPDAAVQAGVSGTVGVRYLVGTSGRVEDCRVTRASGSALLDALTCRLIRERFRFDPSRDARGRPVPAWIVESHEWIVEPDPAPPPARR